jgi:hypothetical protein
MKSGLKVWLDKVKQYKKCSKCGREWTPRSLDKNGLCHNCRKNIIIEYAPWLKEMVESYNKTLDEELFIKTIAELNKQNYFDKEELFLKCPRCKCFVDELIHSDYGVCCYQCYLELKLLKGGDNYDKQNMEL